MPCVCVCVCVCVCLCMCVCLWELKTPVGVEMKSMHSVIFLSGDYKEYMCVCVCGCVYLQLYVYERGTVCVRVYMYVLSGWPSWTLDAAAAAAAGPLPMQSCRPSSLSLWWGSMCLELICWSACQPPRLISLPLSEDAPIGPFTQQEGGKEEGRE